MSRSESLPDFGLPEMCIAVLQPQDVVIGIRRRQRGYFQMYDGTITGAAARQVADQMNQALGVRLASARPC